MPSPQDIRRFQAQPRAWRTACLRTFSPLMTPRGGQTTRGIYRGSGTVTRKIWLPWRQNGNQSYIRVRRR